MKLRWTIAAIMSLGLGACSKKTEPAPAKTVATSPEAGHAPDETTVKLDAEAPAVEGDGTADQAKAAMDAATFEKLILDHADCKVQAEGSIERQCPAVRALQDAMFGGLVPEKVAGGEAAIGKKLLNHASPAVRIKAVGLIATGFSTDKDSQDLVVDAALKEESLPVLLVLIRAVGNEAAKNPKVGKLLLWAADHKDAAVRTTAAYALASPWTRGLEGGPEKLIALMESDADLSVRAIACENAGKLGDAKFLPAFEKLTADTTSLDLLAACTKGLILMWYNPPFYENANEDAYKLTLKVLSTKPRSDKNPMWFIPGTFRSKSVENLTKWKANNPWYDEAKLKAVLVDIIKDADVNWMGRVGAVESLIAHASKAELEALIVDFPLESKGDDARIHQKLSEAIPKAK